MPDYPKNYVPESLEPETHDSWEQKLIEISEAGRRIQKDMLRHDGQITYQSDREDLELLKTASVHEIESLARLLASNRIFYTDNEPDIAASGGSFTAIKRSSTAFSKDDYRDQYWALLDVQIKAGDFIKKHPVDKSPRELGLIGLWTDFSIINHTADLGVLTENFLREIARTTDEQLDDLAKRSARWEEQIADTAAPGVEEMSGDVYNLERLPTSHHFSETGYIKNLISLRDIRQRVRDFTDFDPGDSENKKVN